MWNSFDFGFSFGADFSLIVFGFARGTIYLQYILGRGCFRGEEGGQWMDGRIRLFSLTLLFFFFLSLYLPTSLFFPAFGWVEKRQTLLVGVFSIAVDDGDWNEGELSTYMYLHFVRTMHRWGIHIGTVSACLSVAFLLKALISQYHVCFCDFG
jgi:hypothetical protein